MNCARCEFLAGATLTANQNGCVSGGHTSEELKHLLHARTLADQAAVKRDFDHEPLIFVFQPL